MKLLHRLISAALVLCLLGAALPFTAAAEEAHDFSAGFEPVLLDYMAKHNLTDQNFALGFYHTGTGQTYYYGEDRFLTAASMYKLPLNMIYTDLIAEGRRSEADPLRGRSVGSAMYDSMVYSDNDAAIALCNGLLPDFDWSWTAMWQSLARYSDLSVSELPYNFASANLMSPHLLLQTLRHLYENQEHYAGVLEKMKRANAGHYLRFNDPETYVIAQKYGAIDGFINVSAVVWTPQPYLLVIFTRYALPSGEQVLGDLRDLTTEYALYLEAHAADFPVLSPRDSALQSLRAAMARVRAQRVSEAENG